MLSDDQLLGFRKPDPTELKPLKVRLPLGRVLQLHEMRITGNQSVSEIVATALTEYMEGLQKSKQSQH